MRPLLLACLAVLALLMPACNCDAGARCADGHGGCDVNATCDDTAQGPACTCKAGYIGDGGTCLDVAAALSGLRWSIPCSATLSALVCSCADPAPVSTVLGGAAGASYDVTLRFRGVVEQKSYMGGQQDGGFWQVGGAPAGDTYNVYALNISSPSQTYYLNRGASSITRCWVLDYTQTVRVAAGASVSLTAEVRDGQQISNQDGAGTPLRVDGVSTTPDPYAGQFIQMDVVGITRVP